tara:strand:- start:111 stop:425 length:315 start_codon:yes stop_codon:yes gene_type:complete
MDETNRRRLKQEKYNTDHDITPRSIEKSVGDIMQTVGAADYITVDTGTLGFAGRIGGNLGTHLKMLRKRMQEAASNLEFEEAAQLRDEIRKLEAADLGVKHGRD